MVYKCKTKLLSESEWTDSQIDLDYFHPFKEIENEVHGWYRGVSIKILKDSINFSKNHVSSFI